MALEEVSKPATTDALPSWHPVLLLFLGTGCRLWPRCCHRHRRPAPGGHCLTPGWLPPGPAAAAALIYQAGAALSFWSRGTYSLLLPPLPPMSSSPPPCNPFSLLLPDSSPSPFSPLPFASASAALLAIGEEDYYLEPCERRVCLEKATPSTSSSWKRPTSSSGLACLLPKALQGCAPR